MNPANGLVSLFEGVVVEEFVEEFADELVEPDDGVVDEVVDDVDESTLLGFRERVLLFVLVLLELEALFGEELLELVLGTVRSADPGKRSSGAVAPDKGTPGDVTPGVVLGSAGVVGGKGGSWICDRSCA